MSNASKSVFCVSQDDQLVENVKTILGEEFELAVHQLSKKDLAKLFFMAPPQFIVWDGRIHNQLDEDLLAWVRERFHGVPLIAVIENSSASNDSVWYELGITLFCCSDPDGLRSGLAHNGRAIINDSKYRNTAIIH